MAGELFILLIQGEKTNVNLSFENRAKKNITSKIYYENSYSIDFK